MVAYELIIGAGICIRIELLLKMLRQLDAGRIRLDCIRSDGKLRLTTNGTLGCSSNGFASASCLRRRRRSTRRRAQALVQLLQPTPQWSLRGRELLLRLRRPLPDRLVIESERAPEASLK